MSGTLTPMPGSAPLRRQVAAQARMETRLLLRNGEQLLLAAVIPLLVLLGGIAAVRRAGVGLGGPPVDVLTPGVLALAVLSTSFTSLAIATGFERRYGVIKRLGSSPLPRHGLLLGKVGALLVVQLLQFVVLGVAAAAVGWQPATSPEALLATVTMVVLGTAAFASLGLLLAGAVRAEATLAAANLGYVLMAAGGAVVVPATSYGRVGELLAWLPSGALGEGMRAALRHGDLALGPAAALAGWALLGTVLTARTFRWE